MRGGGFEDVYAAELVFGELVGNAVRHAPGRVEVTIDWSTSAPVLHVLDRGPGFRHTPVLPDDPYSEYGRGLFLISSLTDDFRVSRRPNGGSHARAVLSVGRRRLAHSGPPKQTALFEGIAGAG
jgi:anti-sigma regulatory factor (Ser/Thr protein kinase)